MADKKQAAPAAQQQGQTVTIDGVKYNVADLSKEAKSAINNMALVENELRDLRNRAAIARVAQQVFANQLKAALPKKTK